MEKMRAEGEGAVNRKVVVVRLGTIFMFYAADSVRFTRLPQPSSEKVQISDILAWELLRC